MNITIKQLKVFVCAYEARSFTLAASTLHMTQSAISKICRELEESIDTRLFDRSGRALVPLEGAHALYAAAQDILATVTLAERSLTGLKGMEQGKLNVTASTLIMYDLVTPAVRDFHRQHPGIQIELFELATADGIEHVRSGKVDLGLVSLHEPPSKLQAEKVYESPMWVACSPRHPLAAQATMPLQALPEHRHLGLRSVYGFGHNLNRVLQAAGLRVTSVIESGTLMSSLALARDDLGIVVIPGYVVPLAKSIGLAVVRVDSDVIVHELYLIHREGGWLSPAAQHFIQALKASLRGQPHPAAALTPGATAGIPAR